MMPPREGPPMERRGSRLSRREFVAGGVRLSVASAGTVALGACRGRPGQAQPAAKVPRLGFLAVGRTEGPTYDAFHQGLREHGYTEDTNLLLEWRSADLIEDRLPALAAELVQLPVDLIVTAGTQASLAAAQATTTIPIVTVTGDPVGDGLAASLARPGGNV